MKKPLMGAHVSFFKDTQLLGTVETLIRIGATSGAMYISNSRGYVKSWKIDKEMVKEGAKLSSESNIDIKNIIVHAPIVGNLGNGEKGSPTHQLTVKSYTNDLKRMDDVGLKYYNVHPGSFPDKEKGFEMIIKGLNSIISNTPKSKTVMLLETMSGKGNSLGSSFEDIKRIIAGVKNKSRIGVCIDTCHIWDAGYDIKNDLKGVLKEFNKIIGLEYLKGLHINDSKNKLDSKKDRHELIGKGMIGTKALKAVVNHPKLRNLPKALETPMTGNTKVDEGKWKREMKLLIK